MDENTEQILVSKDKYERLLESAERLSALLAAGVDNWEGYSYAMQLLEERKG